MLVNITEYFFESGREWRIGENPDVPREVAARWIADGKATADTDGARDVSGGGGGGSVTVENILTSTSTANALSAAMGKSLKDTADALATTVSGKQATLVSGTSIKTINGQAVLGSGDLSVALNTTTTLEHLPSTTAWAATLTPASYISRFGFSTNVAITVTVAGVTSPAANIQIQYSNDAGVSVASGPTTIGTISANGTQTINLNPLTMPGAMFKVLINSGTGTGGTVGINVTMS